MCVLLDGFLTCALAERRVCWPVTERLSTRCIRVYPSFDLQAANEVRALIARAGAATDADRAALTAEIAAHDPAATIYADDAERASAAAATLTALVAHARAGAGAAIASGGQAASTSA